MPVFERAFLTGASSGIGRGVALEFARRGTRVVAAARRRDRLDELVAEAPGGRIEACELDVSDPRRVAEVVAAEDERVGGFDLVIANAGVANYLGPDPLSLDNVLNIAQVNFTGALATLVAGKDAMLPRGRGTLVGVASLAGFRGLPDSGAYSASKAGLQTFLESLSLDLEGTGLTVVDISPGFIRSEMTDRNAFRMPFLMETEEAVQRFVDAVEAGLPQVTFPWQLAVPLRIGAKLAPRGLWRRAVRGAKGTADRRKGS
jgi:short-subunit dehydrogenase